jgi:type IV secretion system protein VirB6
MSIAAHCQNATDGVGSGIAASLRAVDCAAESLAQTTFGRLFGTDGALLPALIILLTLYVAFFGFALMTGRSRLGMSELIPRMVTIGLVLTFATSWLAYQSLVWNLAIGAPDWLASLMTGVKGSATQVFADKLDIVFASLVEASGATPTTENTATTFSPPGLLWLGGTLLLLGTVGILATSKIALAILLGLGPVFVVMALFGSTRGLFVGWLKGVVLLALAPLFAVIGGSLMLDLSVPVLRTLAENPSGIDAKAAMAFFMIGAVHVALMIMVLKIAGTIVSGWTVFGLSGTLSVDESTVSGSAPPVFAPAAPAAALEPERLAPSRAIRLASAAPVAANDPGYAVARSREAKIIAATAASAAAASSVAANPNASLSRTRGIGSRFRAPASARLARSMEKSS